MKLDKQLNISWLSHPTDWVRIVFCVILVVRARRLLVCTANSNEKYAKLHSSCAPY